MGQGGTYESNYAPTELCWQDKLYTSEHLHNNTMDTHASTVTTFQRIHTDTWPLVCTGTFPAKKILLFASHSSPAGHRGIVRYLSHHRLHHYVHCPSSFLAMWSPSERWDNLYMLWVISGDFNRPEIILKVVGNCFIPWIQFGNSYRLSRCRRIGACFEKIRIEQEKLLFWTNRDGVLIPSHTTLGIDTTCGNSKENQRKWHRIAYDKLSIHGQWWLFTPQFDGW